MQVNGYIHNVTSFLSGCLTRQPVVILIFPMAQKAPQ